MHWRTIARRRASQFRREALSRAYGFPIEEAYDLSQTFVQFALPRLKAFRDRTCSHPVGVTPYQWEEILGEIIEGFEAYAKQDYGNPDDYEKMERALDLFRKWYRDLWW